MFIISNYLSGKENYIFRGIVPDAIQLCFCGYKDTHPQIKAELKNLSSDGKYIVECNIAGINYSESHEIMIKRMETKEIIFDVPNSTKIEKDYVAEVTFSVNKDGNIFESVSYTTTLLPIGRYDRTGSMTDALMTQITNKDMKESRLEVTTLMNDTYSELSDFELSEAPSYGERFISISTPDDVKDYGEGTEIELACLYASKLNIVGYDVALLLNQEEAYVGLIVNEQVSNVENNILFSKLADCKNPIIFIRPSDSIRKMPINLSLDKSFETIKRVGNISIKGRTVSWTTNDN